MLRHSKIVMLSLHNWVFLISPLYAHAWYAQKEKICKEYKSKKNQNAFKYGCKRVSTRCGSYRMYLEGDSPHQAVMIVREWNWFFHISNRHNMYAHMQSCNVFHTQHAIFFAILDTCAGTMWSGHHKVLRVLMYAY